MGEVWGKPISWRFGAGESQVFMLCSASFSPSRPGEKLDERNAMLFARRAIQRRLNELRGTLGNAVVDSLAARLNQPDNQRLAAMWEAVVLHALSKHGVLGHEAPLPSG
ncbi:MAG: hypothetical protein POG24_03775, partial [Acidocella sp.]|nr:hypothetical protein [Acidocella sp.]